MLTNVGRREDGVRLFSCHQGSLRLLALGLRVGVVRESNQLRRTAEFGRCKKAANSKVWAVAAGRMGIGSAGPDYVNCRLRKLCPPAPRRSHSSTNLNLQGKANLDVESSTPINDAHQRPPLRLLSRPPHNQLHCLPVYRLFSYSTVPAASCSAVENDGPLVSHPPSLASPSPQNTSSYHLLLPAPRKHTTHAGAVGSGFWSCACAPPFVDVADNIVFPALFTQLVNSLTLPKRSA